MPEHSQYTPILGELREAIRNDDHDLVAHLALKCYGALVALEMAQKVPKERKRSGTVSWLTPVAEVWEREMGAFPFGRAAKALTPLSKMGHTPETIAKRLEYYCKTVKRNGETKFATLERFAQTYHEYDPDAKAFEDA